MSKHLTPELVREIDHCIFLLGMDIVQAHIHKHIKTHNPGLQEFFDTMINSVQDRQKLILGDVICDIFDADNKPSDAPLDMTDLQTYLDRSTLWNESFKDVQDEVSDFLQGGKNDPER